MYIYLLIVGQDINYLIIIIISQLLAGVYIYVLNIFVVESHAFYAQSSFILVFWKSLLLEYLRNLLLCGIILKYIIFFITRMRGIVMSGTRYVLRVRTNRNSSMFIGTRRLLVFGISFFRFVDRPRMNRNWSEFARPFLGQSNFPARRTIVTIIA